MSFAGVCVRNLLRRPLRTAMTALGVAVAVAGFVALVGSTRGLAEAWESSLDERGAHLLALRRGTVELLASSVDQSLVSQVAAVEGVEAAAGELGGLVLVEGGHTAVAVGWAAEGFLWDQTPLADGRRPRPGESDVVLPGQAIARMLEKSIGDTLVLQDRQLRVIGIPRFASSLNNSTLFLPLGTMQEVTGKPERLTGLKIRLDRGADPEHLERMKADLTHRFQELTFVESGELVADDKILGLLGAAAWSVSIVALLMGAVVILNTLMMSVTERTREIGTLSAIGWSARRVLSMIVVEGVLLSAAGGVIGCAAGLLGLWLMAASPATQGFLEPSMSLEQLAEVATAAVALGVMGGLYPGWRAVRLNPGEALRHE